MFKLLKRKVPAVVPPAKSPSVPDGTSVWAVGDIHGRLDLVVPLVGAIAKEARARPSDRTLVVFLGDYVDRGPDSRGVLQLLSALSGTEEGVEWRFLKGNHEETMLRFLDDPSVGPQWCEYGGIETLQSYGLSPPGMRHRAEAWVPVSGDLGHRLTPGERAFLEGLELSLSIGDYFFAHAGARPGATLDRQDAGDLMWIRRSFLDDTQPFEKVVVHGHTPTAVAHFDHRRIGIDTKAYQSGVLSALRLAGKTRLLMQAVSEDDGSVVLKLDAQPPI